MIKLRLLHQAFRVYKDSENLGDFALLKADALGARVEPAVEAKMEQVKGYYPAIYLSKLSQLSPGTFGYEYTFFMECN